MKMYQQMENDDRKSLKAWKDQIFSIDAYDKGNLGRFLNHQCGDANVRLQTVFINNQDYRLPVQVRVVKLLISVYTSESLKIKNIYIKISSKSSSKSK